MKGYQRACLVARRVRVVGRVLDINKLQLRVGAPRHEDVVHLDREFAFIPSVWVRSRHSSQLTLPHGRVGGNRARCDAEARDYEMRVKAEVDVNTNLVACKPLTWSNRTSISEHRKGAPNSTENAFPYFPTVGGLLTEEGTHLIEDEAEERTGPVCARMPILADPHLRQRNQRKYAHLPIPHSLGVRVCKTGAGVFGAKGLLMSHGLQMTRPGGGGAYASPATVE